MHRAISLGLLALILFAAAPAEAYVGPGAGIAYLSTAATLLVTIIIAILAVVLWPVRQIYFLLTNKRPPRPPKIKRAVIVGLDGLDPDLAKQFMDEGLMPVMQKISQAGMFQKLGTTFPAASPVAWSSFATGVNPGKHGIYDFFTRDKATYLPDLSSASVGPPARSLKIGPYHIPIGKPQVKLLRKSKPFWQILSRYRVPCSVLRVPITFPAERISGTMLSGMCVPDLQGSQGTYSHFTAGATTGDDDGIGGRRLPLRADGDVLTGALPGPTNPLRPDRQLEMPFSITPGKDSDQRILRVGKERFDLKLGEFTDWITVEFKMGLGLNLRGICRFRLLSLEPLRMYASPVNIDPAKPVLPISYPFYFSIFLAKLIGRFATLGLAEDTWALNDGVLDEDAFLDQSWSIHQEREAMFFEMLRRSPRGVVTCVFDVTDRIQHMFMRYHDDGHPAARDDDQAMRDKYRHVIRDTYIRMDAMLGRVLDKVNIEDPGTLLMVVSDHGFKTFRRGVNLNTWLHKVGYLHLKEGLTESGEWLEGVDWSKTRAFSLGLGGMFLNVQGREKQGIVEPGEEATKLRAEIAKALSGLEDPDLGTVAIREAFPSDRIYHGAYTADAPDLVIGYSVGWRASWDCVRGIVNDVMFDDNEKAWSGDHCMDPELVPGVLVSSMSMTKHDRRPAIVDLAPTLLELFGVPAPQYMDGRSLV